MSGARGDYVFTEDFAIDEHVKKDFDDLGYILIRNLLNSDEIQHVAKALANPEFEKNTYGVADGQGKAAHLVLWNQPGDDVTGMVARCEKVAGTSEKLLGGEVYHYSSKLMKKPARIGGQHIWHQDYGYWYNNGLLFPDALTVFIAVDDCKKENGCLQILPCSHKCGRIEHKLIGGQTGADLERVDQIAKVCPLQFVEMNSGDALFFHCNLLHCSSANTSEKRRWALLTAFNRASNNPVIKHDHPQYTPLHKVKNSAILECSNFDDLSGKDFFNFEKAQIHVVEGKRITEQGH
ncbi:hypothetical protein ACJMK2_038636 [Sinanodonta woodiana]|uniref:Ectoine hydroxylase n=1 Tax=Sinanodonta woodiana TaxID=1069815 RepID=A0ABD3WAF7_SINWO